MYSEDRNLSQANHRSLGNFLDKVGTICCQNRQQKSSPNMGAGNYDEADQAFGKLENQYGKILPYTRASTSLRLGAQVCLGMPVRRQTAWITRVCMLGWVDESLFIACIV